MRFKHWIIAIRSVTTLVSTIETHFQAIIPVCCKNCNNSTRRCRIQEERLVLTFCTSLDEIQTFEHQNPTGIGKDTTISVSINGTRFHHDIMFVVTSLITLQPLACSDLPDQQWKIQIMDMRLEYLIVQIQTTLMEIQQFLSTSIKNSFTPSLLFVVTNAIAQQPIICFEPKFRC
jgi:hypothetical protein